MDLDFPGCVSTMPYVSQFTNFPSKPPLTHNPMEFILDTFGSRRYEANLWAVTYDKGLAVKFTKAILQLNEVLVGQELRPTGLPLRNVIAGGFVDTFRIYDPHG
jgi:serine/arginine repetitive matrix protein 2